MGVLVLSRPSTWSAVKNPTVYKLIREDYPTFWFHNNAGLVRVQVVGTDAATYFEAGNSIYTFLSGIYSHSGTVLSTFLSGGDSFIETDIPIVDPGGSNGSGGVINNISKRTDYRLEVEVFRATDDESLTDGVVFSFTPGSHGIAYCDISSIVKAHLSPEWTEPTSLNEVEEDTSLEIYIKYQEYYDGVLVGSQTSDSANPVHCVFGGLQIPSLNGNNLTDYVPASSSKQFLTIFENPKLWRGYPATLSMIYPDGLAALYLARTQYDGSGTIINTIEYDELNAANDDSINRLDLTSGITLDADAEELRVKLALYGVGAEILINTDFAAGLGPTWANEAGAGTNWIWNAGGYAENDLAGSGAVSDNLLGTIGSTKTAGWYVFTYETELEVTGITVIIEVYNSGVLVQEIVNEAIVNPTLSTHTKLVYIAGSFNQIKIRASYGSAGTPIIKLHSFSSKPFSPTDYTETLTFEVSDPCNNPVMLFWKNSLGGDSFWLFEHDQEVSYNLSGRKAKRMVLSARDLTADQWEALNELNHLGEVYKENIQEFTSSVNKSHKRDGAQVYIVDTDGNKTGVIVIPTNNVMFTRQQKHQFTIEIELPERYE